MKKDKDYRRNIKKDIELELKWKTPDSTYDRFYNSYLRSKNEVDISWATEGDLRCSRNVGLNTTDCIANFLCNQSIHAILTGDLNGWTDLHHTLMYTDWQLRSVFGCFNHDPRPIEKRSHYRNWSLLMATVLHFLYIGDKQTALWYRPYLEEARRANKFGVDDDTGFIPYGFKLIRLFLDEPLDLDIAETPHPLEVYEPLLANWDTPDPASLTEAVYATCEYHAYRSWYEKGGSVFHFGLYRLFPIEILALNRLRANHGLAPLSCDHPLLQTPLANPPQPLPQPEPDETLQKIIAHITREFPECRS